MNWWIGHVFVNRDLSLPTETKSRKSTLVGKVVSRLGRAAYKLLIEMIRRLKVYLERQSLKADHWHLNDHLLRDVGYTRLQWELLMDGKTVERTPESVKHESLSKQSKVQQGSMSKSVDIEVELKDNDFSKGFNHCCPA